MPKATIPNPKAIQSKMNSRRVLRLRSVLLVMELIRVDRSIEFRDSGRNPKTEPHMIDLRVWVMIFPFTSTGWLPLPGRTPVCPCPSRKPCVRIRCTHRDERSCPDGPRSIHLYRNSDRYTRSRCNNRHQHSSLSQPLMVIPMIFPTRTEPFWSTI